MATIDIRCVCIPQPGKRATSAAAASPMPDKSESRGGLLRTTGKQSLGALDSAAVVLSTTELARIKQASILKTAEDLRRDAAEAEAERAVKLAQSKQRKVGTRGGGRGWHILGCMHASRLAMLAACVRCCLDAIF